MTNDLTAMVAGAGIANGGHSSLNFVNAAAIYQEFMVPYESAIKVLETNLEIFQNESKSKGCHVPIETVTGRLKHPQSILDKLSRRGVDFSLTSITENITDIAGVRVICPYISDIYRVRKWLLGVDGIFLVTEKDYIVKPKASGYRSLHMILSVPVSLSTGTEYVTAEVQLRTIAMDSWASLEHSIRYKNAYTFSQDDKNNLKHCSDMLYASDLKMQEIAEKVNIFDNLEDVNLPPEARIQTAFPSAQMLSGDAAAGTAETASAVNTAAESAAETTVKDTTVTDTTAAKTAAPDSADTCSKKAKRKSKKA